MKHINKIISSICALLILCTACDDDFFDKKPTGAISEEAYWTTENDVKSWMSGTYSGVQDVMSASYTLWGDGRSDNFYPTIYDNADSWQLNALTSNISQTDWTALYDVIDRCNIALAKLDAMTIADLNKSYYKGQFYSIRALMYFYAIRLWGDVPLVVEAWNGDRSALYLPRTDVREIKVQIESDLKNAVNELALNVDAILPPNSSCFYFNKASAMALKMSVHMWFKEFQEALEASDFIIETKKYNLVTNPTDWKNIFLKPESSSETMLTLTWTDTNDKNLYGSKLCSSDKNPSFSVSREVFSLLLRDKRDVRLWGVLDTLAIFNAANKISINPFSVTPGAQRGDKLTKFCSFEYTISTTKDTTITFTIPGQNYCYYKLPLIRYADVLLMRAEILNKMDRPQEALDIVNAIRSRCGNGIKADLSTYNVKSGTSVASRERCILDERQAEFYGEGIRWFDLLRADNNQDGSTPNFDFYMDNHLKDLQNYFGTELVGFGNPQRKLLPIYYKVFVYNPLLRGHQNLPYSE